MELRHDASVAGGGERTILGGLKTKKVDVVVTQSGIGPCMAISIKGTQRAVRNLTNRLEEAVGDCTNLHISYPALVYGFLHVLQANQEGKAPEYWKHQMSDTGDLNKSDVVLRADGAPHVAVMAYHDALARLANRFDMRDDPSRYESVALLLADFQGGDARPHSAYPDDQSPLCFGHFFQRLYEAYDRRFVYSASSLANQTARRIWSDASPAFEHCHLDYTPRTSNDPQAMDQAGDLSDLTAD